MRYGEVRFDHWLLHGKVRYFFYLYKNNMYIYKYNNFKKYVITRLLIYQQLQNP